MVVCVAAWHLHPSTLELSQSPLPKPQRGKGKGIWEGKGRERNGGWVGCVNSSATDQDRHWLTCTHARKHARTHSHTHTHANSRGSRQGGQISVLPVWLFSGQISNIWWKWKGNNVVNEFLWWKKRYDFLFKSFHTSSFINCHFEVGEISGQKASKVKQMWIILKALLKIRWNYARVSVVKRDPKGSGLLRSGCSGNSDAAAKQRLQEQRQRGQAKPTQTDGRAQTPRNRTELKNDEQLFFPRTDDKSLSTLQSRLFCLSLLITLTDALVLTDESRGRESSLLEVQCCQLERCFALEEPF